MSTHTFFLELSLLHPQKIEASLGERERERESHAHFANTCGREMTIGLQALFVSLFLKGSIWRTINSSTRNLNRAGTAATVFQGTESGSGLSRNIEKQCSQRSHLDRKPGIATCFTHELGDCCQVFPEELQSRSSLTYSPPSPDFDLIRGFQV